MRLLLTDTTTRLGESLRQALAGAGELSVLDADPRDRDAAAAAVRDVETLVHLIPPVRDDDDLDALDRAGRGTYNLLTTGSLTRCVLITSLRPFERYPPTWNVSEAWVPRPTPEVASLVPYLAETVAREVARARPLSVLVLRLGEVVEDETRPAGAPDSRWLHLEDAVQAAERALAFTPEPPDTTRWRVFHIVDGGRLPRFPLGAAADPSFDYVPRHRLTDGASLTPSEPPVRPAPPPARPIHDVVIYGAGGPLGAATAAALERDHRLRLTDVRPLAELAKKLPQSPGAPLPRPPSPPHEERQVDITNPVHVAAAAEGMDAIINCTVVRHDPDEAFRVNLLGAYNVMRAAVAHRIRRVVHTGPIQTLLPHPAGYGADFHLPADVPARPGDNLYFVSKLLGQEVCRVFAEEYGLEVPALFFGDFVNPALPPAERRILPTLAIAWDDAAEAMRQAVRVPAFPRPFEVLHINADLPHGQYPNDKAKQLLGWQPRHRLDAWWTRDIAAAGQAAANEP